MPYCIDTKYVVSTHTVIFTPEYRYNDVCIDTKSKNYFQSQDLEAHIDTLWICIDTHAYVSIHFAKNHNFSYYQGLYRYKHAKYRYHTLGIDTKPSCINTTHENSSFSHRRGLVSILTHQYNLQYLRLFEHLTLVINKEINLCTHLNDLSDTLNSDL